MIRRAIEERVQAALGDTPVVLIHGARQTGKTTLVRRLARERGSAYFTMDDAVTLAAALRDPQGFVGNLSPSAVIDEAQRVPALFSAIKLVVDRRRTPGRFLLTGSANVLALPRISESLAGRTEVIPLFPFAQSELEKSSDNFVDWLYESAPSPVGEWKSRGKIWQQRIIAGGFPEPVLRRNEKRRGAWFESYVSTILQRDIRDLAHVEGLASLPNLLGLLASRTANLLNIADIARVVGIPQTTATRYLSLLEALFLAVRLPPWFANIGKRLSKTPKIHLCDTGLACHLLHLSLDRLRQEPILLGSLLESFAFMELRKQASWANATVRLFYYRTIAGAEVDLVLEDRQGRLVGVEIKSAATVKADDFRGLHSLAESARHHFHRGVVLYAGNVAVPFGKNLWALPIQALWHSMGRNSKDVKK